MEFSDCLCGFLGRRKKDKEKNKSPEMVGNKGLVTLLQVKMDGQDKPFSIEMLSNSFTFPRPSTLPRTSRFKDDVISHETPEDSVSDTEAAACDKKEDDLDQPIGQDLNLNRNLDHDSDTNCGLEVVRSGHLTDQGICMTDLNLNGNLDRDSDTNCGLEIVRSGHLTDPGICMTEFWPSTRLARSCSDLGLRGTMVKRASPSKSQSFTEFGIYQEGINGISGSPFSATTHWSADQVLLKKYSSSNSIKTESFFTENTQPPLKCFQEISVSSPQNETVTFPMQSPTMTRVDEWIKGLVQQQQPFKDVKEGDVDQDVDLPRSRSPARNSTHSNGNPKSDVNEEILHAISLVRALNSSSTVAHMVAVGLKVVPQLSKFTSLRFVNLSSNSIVHIAPGSLPRSLHTLNLSKNNINGITGLRELTRLRVLDLSHNRISQISQGLSNSRHIKELYLAENKISEVDGLHRLLKLSVLDLSFNKIATTKALGQLVANYNSLMALNLLGNPIHTNINDDQLRKNLRSLLPELTFLNKQPINNQKLREAGTRAMSKFAAGPSHRTIHRKVVRKVSRNASIYKS